MRIARIAMIVSVAVVALAFSVKGAAPAGGLSARLKVGETYRMMIGKEIMPFKVLEVTDGEIVKVECLKEYPGIWEHSKCWLNLNQVTMFEVPE